MRLTDLSLTEAEKEIAEDFAYSYCLGENPTVDSLVAAIEDAIEATRRYYGEWGSLFGMSEGFAKNLAATKELLKKLKKEGE